MRRKKQCAQEQDLYRAKENLKIISNHSPVARNVWTFAAAGDRRRDDALYAFVMAIGGYLSKSSR